MGVGVNPAGHHIAPAGINHRVAGKFAPNRYNLAVFDQHISTFRKVCIHYRAATNKS